MYVQVYPEPAWCLSTMFLKQDLKYIYIYIYISIFSVNRSEEGDVRITENVKLFC